MPCLNRVWWLRAPKRVIEFCIEHWDSQTGQRLHRKAVSFRISILSFHNSSYVSVCDHKAKVVHQRDTRASPPTIIGTPLKLFFSVLLECLRRTGRSLRDGLKEDRP